MRVLLVNYEYPPLGGGAGNATRQIAAEMASLGADVSVLTSAFRDLPRRETARKVQIFRVPVLRRRADRCNPLEMLTFMAMACCHIPAICRSKRPDISIAFFGIPSGPVSYFMSLLCKVPYIVSLRGGDVPGFQPYDLKLYHTLTAPVIHYLWKRASAVVANSLGLASLAGLSAPDVPVDVIPNGVDTAAFRPSEPPRMAGPIRLLFVGRLTRQKGLDVLIQALDKLEPGNGVSLTIVGDGPLMDDLRNQARSLGIADSIEFKGWLSRDLLPDEYRKHDVFVLPSRDEGMPNVLLEAMASGLPAVATDIAGNNELVREGATGLLIPPNDADLLCSALAKLKDNPDLIAKMGKTARVLARDKYSWTSVAQAYLEKCRAIFGGKRND